MNREVESLKSELRALRTGHLSTSEVRLPWTREEKHRYEVNGHAEYDNRCENLREIEWHLPTSSSCTQSLAPSIMPVSHCKSWTVALLC